MRDLRYNVIQIGLVEKTVIQSIFPWNRLYLK